jgi:hypothetical protein
MNTNKPRLPDFFPKKDCVEAIIYSLCLGVVLGYAWKTIEVMR